MSEQGRQQTGRQESGDPQCKFLSATEGREERVPSKDHEAQERLCSQMEPASAGSLGSHQRCIDCEMNRRSLTRPGGHKRPDPMGMNKWDTSLHRAPPWRGTCLAVLFMLEPLSPLRYFNLLQSLLLHGISFLFI